MALKDSEITGALESLAIFGNTIARIHGNQLNSDRQMLESKRARDHDEKMRKEDRDHDIKLRQTEYRRRIQQENPGITLLENGEFDFEGYELGKSKKVTEIRIENMAAKGIDTSGTDDQLLEREKAYNISYGKFLNSGAGEYSPAVSQAFGGDVSPGLWTPSDITSLDNIIENSKVNYDDDQWSTYGPVAIQNLIELNLIPDSVAIDWSEGFPKISTSDSHLIDATIRGMKSGVTDNANFMSTAAYTEYKNKESQDGILFANQIAGTTFTTDASNQLVAMYQGLANGLGFSQTENGDIIMNWKGKPVKWEDIVESGGHLDDALAKIANVDRKQNVKTLFDNLQKVGPNGGGAPLMLASLDSLNNTEWTQLVSDLKAIGQTSLAESIGIIRSQRAKIDTVVDMTSNYMQDPVTLEELLGLRTDLQSSGVYSNFQKIRNLQLQGFSDDKTIIVDGKEVDNPMYNEELDNLVYNNIQSVTSIYDQLIKNGDTKVEEQLTEWLMLEEATFDLSKQSIKWRSK